MKLAWLVMAEGLAQDAEGALTGVGLERNVLVAQSLPTLNII